MIFKEVFITIKINIKLNVSVIGINNLPILFLLSAFHINESPYLWMAFSRTTFLTKQYFPIWNCTWNALRQDQVYECTRAKSMYIFQGPICSTYSWETNKTYRLIVNYFPLDFVNIIGLNPTRPDKESPTLK